MSYLCMLHRPNLVTLLYPISILHVAATRFVYEPSSNQQSLRCSQSLDGIPVFEQYGRIPEDAQKARLDNFAIQLLNQKDLRGYVIVDGGKGNSNVALRQLRFIKNYLFRTRAVPVDRVMVLEDHASQDFTVRLYLVTKKISLPLER